VDGLEATLGSSFWFGLPVLVDPGVVSSDGFLSYFTFLLQYMRDVCQKGDNALDFEIKRIQRTIFNSNGARRAAWSRTVQGLDTPAYSRLICNHQCPFRCVELKGHE
jgi:hypothetical protein